MSHLRAFKSPQLANYLANYAEPEARYWIAGPSGHSLGRNGSRLPLAGCLVIPAFDEPFQGTEANSIHRG